MSTTAGDAAAILTPSTVREPHLVGNAWYTPNRVVYDLSDIYSNIAVHYDRDYSVVTFSHLVHTRLLFPSESEASNKSQMDLWESALMTRVEEWKASRHEIEGLRSGEIGKWGKAVIDMALETKPEMARSVGIKVSSGLDSQLIDAYEEWKGQSKEETAQSRAIGENGGMSKDKKSLFALSRAVSWDIPRESPTLTGFTVRAKETNPFAPLIDIDETGDRTLDGPTMSQSEPEGPGLTLGASFEAETTDFLTGDSGRPREQSYKRDSPGDDYSDVGSGVRVTEFL